MITSAAYAMDRSVPNDVLAMADRIWFGADRPFQAAREAFVHIEDDLERWDQELEAERSHIAQSILGVRPEIYGMIIQGANPVKSLRQNPFATSATRVLFLYVRMTDIVIRNFARFSPGEKAVGSYATYETARAARTFLVFVDHSARSSTTT
jgi:hypothetical protein